MTVNQTGNRLTIPKKHDPTARENLDTIEHWANSQTVNQIVAGAGVTITQQALSVGAGQSGRGIVTVSAAGYAFYPEIPNAVAETFPWLSTGQEFVAHGGRTIFFTALTVPVSLSTLNVWVGIGEPGGSEDPTKQGLAVYLYDPATDVATLVSQQLGFVTLTNPGSPKGMVDTTLPDPSEIIPAGSLLYVAFMIDQLSGSVLNMVCASYNSQQVVIYPPNNPPQGGFIIGQPVTPGVFPASFTASTDLDGTANPIWFAVGP